jgi:phenylalanyl-tRNA synthetase beta chain
MRAPLSWLREFVAIPADQTGRDVAARLIAAGLEVETVESAGAGITGTLRVGRVLEIEELAEFKKPIRWCQVDLGDEGVRGVICGARNFAVGDLVVVALPGVVLPGGFAISARPTYGKVSDGMICSARELGLGDDHSGILVLESGEPGSDAGPLLGIGEEILDIAITPDRGYALSIRGIAREAAIAYDLPFEDPGTALVDLPAPSAERLPHPCGSDDPVGCDLFTLRTIVGFDPAAPSPEWMQRRLVACGMRPVSLAVDVTNYVMLEVGQPLHAFDLDKLRGPVRAARAQRGEVLETLDHVRRELDEHDLVIRDDRGPIGLAGVMGGLDSEIDDGTTSIALEAAHFDATVIARAGRRHRLGSEASRRFERGVDRALAPYASARAAALLLQFGGGHYVGMTAVESPQEPTVITLPISLPGDVAGAVIEAEEVRASLTAIGCTLSGADPLSVEVPTWRPDLRDPIDLVEEVLRLHGYEQLPATLPPAPLGGGLTPRQRLRRRVGTALAARGSVEVLCYPFVGGADLDAMGLPAGDPGRDLPRLANPLSEEAPFLRGSLLPGLLAAARRNLARGQADLALFEIGTVFHGSVAGEATVRPTVDRRPAPEELSALEALLPDQRIHVGLILCGALEPAGWWGPARPVTWADALAEAQAVVAAAGAVAEVVPGDDPAFHPGRCARLLVGGVAVGVAGELHPRTTAAFGVPERSCAAVLDLDAIAATVPPRAQAPEVGTQPVAKEDLALVVDRGVPVADVAQALRAGAGPLLESVRLFDVYEGPQVPEGKRSMAFALRLRAPDRTLGSAEIAEVRAAALASAEQHCGATLRA